ncbi:hypothetical protein [Nocardia sp. NPDC050435]|uniref:hypothetical protein n=1 Tax=Nocardia sp. NPDC050435 TaxID=3155040 RepID=UPI0033FB04CF
MSFDSKTGTYTLNTAPLGHIGWEIADWTDTVMATAAALRRGETLPAPRIEQALADSRRLAEALAALDDELLVMARQENPLLSLRALAEAFGRHHTTINDRLKNITAGKQALRRNWLLGLPFDGSAEISEPTRKGL